MDEFLFRYRADLVSVHDADTVTLDLDLGLRVRARVTARLYGPDPDGRVGLDAPELNTPEGIAARDWLVARLAGAELVVRTVADKTEKFGRWLVVLYARRAGSGWANVNAELLAAGHAKPKT